jgi:hypothetical protein
MRASEAFTNIANYTESYWATTDKEPRETILFHLFSPFILIPPGFSPILPPSLSLPPSLPPAISLLSHHISKGNIVGERKERESEKGERERERERGKTLSMHLCVLPYF